VQRDDGQLEMALQVERSCPTDIWVNFPAGTFALNPEVNIASNPIFANRLVGF
jgi:hypothetical protein